MNKKLIIFVTLFLLILGTTFIIIRKNENLISKINREYKIYLPKPDKEIYYKELNESITYYVIEYKDTKRLDNFNFNNIRREEDINNFYGILYTADQDIKNVPKLELLNYEHFYKEKKDNEIYIIRIENKLYIILSNYK